MKKMDAVLLAGGFARRMWPLTKNRPKHLLPVAGREMLSFTLDPLLEMDVMERIYISTNEAFGEQFTNFLKSYDDKRIELVIEPSPSEERKLGSIGGLGYLIDSRDLSRDTILIGADNMFEFHPMEAVKVFEREQRDLVAVYDVRDMERAKLYGIVDVNEEGVIERFLEKPQNPPSTLAATAFYIFKSDTIEMIPRYLDDGGLGDALGHFIAYLVERKPVIAWSFPGRWFDIGSLEVYHEADDYFTGIGEREDSAGGILS